MGRWLDIPYEGRTWDPNGRKNATGISPIPEGMWASGYDRNEINCPGGTFASNNRIARLIQRYCLCLSQDMNIVAGQTSSIQTLGPRLIVPA